MNRWRPTLIPGADFMKLALSPEEGFLLSRIDDATTVTQLNQLTRVPMPALCSTLWRLIEARVLQPAPERLARQIAEQLLIARRQSQASLAKAALPVAAPVAAVPTALAQPPEWTGDIQTMQGEHDGGQVQDDACFGESEDTEVGDQEALEALMADMQLGLQPGELEEDGAEPPTEDGVMPWTEETT